MKLLDTTVAIDHLRGVQDAVNRMARGGQTRDLVVMIERFRKNRFLGDYIDPVRLLYRLNQVMRRIKLRPLPDEVEDVLRAGCNVVRDRAGRLLPDWNSVKPT